MRRAVFTVLLVLLSVLLAGPTWAAASFRRGDVNADGATNLGDAVFLFNYLFLEGQTPTCEASADIDGSGAVTLTDPVFLLNFLFLSGETPPGPFTECGRRSAPLPCENFAPCDDAEIVPFFGAGGTLFLGEDLRGGGIVFVVDRSPPLSQRNTLDLIKSDISVWISEATPERQLGFVFYDRAIIRFPASGQALSLDTPAAKQTAISFLQGIPGGRGTCPIQAILAALDMATTLSAEPAGIVLVTDGGGTCSGATEMAYLRDGLDTLLAENTTGIPFHVFAHAPGAIQREWLETLAEESGGTYQVFFQ